MDKRDYYEILGLSRNAGEDEIKKTYRKLALQYHPDRNLGDKEAEEKFKELSEAYSVLSDPEKRSKFDQFGHAAFGESGPFAGGFDFSHGFEDVFGDIFGEFFGGSSPGPREISGPAGRRPALQPRGHVRAGRVRHRKEGQDSPPRTLRRMRGQRR